jgi:2,4'-dihydroxyacetophenone dioxygenase
LTAHGLFNPTPLTNKPEQLNMTLEIHHNWREIVDSRIDNPEGWIEFPSGLRQFFLWQDEKTGASFAILDFPEGAGVPTKHIHASNQFMICVEGEYAYPDSNIILKPGSFYSNPKDHPHGPTKALKRSILIEIYDGPHYYEKPEFHSVESYKAALSTNEK